MVRSNRTPVNLAIFGEHKGTVYLAKIAKFMEVRLVKMAKYTVLVC